MINPVTYNLFTGDYLELKTPNGTVLMKVSFDRIDTSARITVTLDQALIERTILSSTQRKK